MEALIVNTEDSKIDLSYLSICLRTSYLFIDRIGMAGDMKMNMYLNEDFHSIPLAMKYKLLKDYNEESEYNIENINKVEKFILKESKLKHKDVKGFTFTKRSESASNNWLNSKKNFINMDVTESGLLELKDLIEEDVFSLYKLDKREEIPNLSPNIFIKPSKLLQLLCPEHSITDTLFTLTDEVSDPDFLEDRKIHDVNSKEALQESNIFFEKCFTFPATISLSIGELKLLRDKLYTATLPFNETLDNWADMFASSGDIASRVDFFKNNILPLLPAIQKTITENNILNYGYKRTKDVSVEVWLGEVPLSIVWEYYNYFQLISEASYNILFESLDKNPEYNKRVPVMVIATVGKGKDNIKNFMEENEAEEEVFLIPRKSILINE